MLVPYRVRINKNQTVSTDLSDAVRTIHSHGIAVDSYHSLDMPSGPHGRSAWRWCGARECQPAVSLPHIDAVDDMRGRAEKLFSRYTAARPPHGGGYPAGIRKRA